MSDELFGFDSAIKSLYPEDYDEICKFAQSVVSKASAVQTTFEENEFPQFVGKLNFAGCSGGNNTQLFWRTIHLSFGTNFDDKLAGQIRYKVGGGFYGNDHEFSIIELGQYRLLFLRWDKDGKTTRIFWNGKQVALVNKLICVFKMQFFGGIAKVQNPDGDILFTIHFPFIFLQLFYRRRIYCSENQEVSFPNGWPNSGILREKSLSDLANVPFEKQILIIAILLWSRSIAGNGN